jgi:amidase
VTVDPAGQGCDPAVAAGVRRAAEALAEAGYRVAEVEPPRIAEGAALWSALILAEARLAEATVRPLLGPDAQRFNDLLLASAPALDLAGYVAGFATRAAIARAWSLFQADWPLVLGPVNTIAPPPVGFDLADADAAAAVVRAHRLTTLVNLLGLPSVAVPAGLADGLPQGVQLIAPRVREDLCLDAAQAIEDRLGTLTPIDPRGQGA